MKWKQQTFKIMKKIFCLSPVSTLVVAIPSFVLVIYVLANNMQNMPLAYFSYGLSAYALVITITGLAGIVKWMRLGIGAHPQVKRLLGFPLIERFFSEATFRTETFLYQGLLINLLYVGIKLFSGFYFRSIWFVTLAVYYILLAVMRFSLIHHMRKRGAAGEDKVSELRCYRLCGILLLFMNWTLVGIIILVIKMNSGFVYSGLLIYAMALYTFYSTIAAAINVVKYRKYGSLTMSAAKVISLTAVFRRRGV